MKNILLLCISLAIAGCSSHSFLDSRTVPDRADYGNDVIQVPITPVPHVPLINADPNGTQGPVIDDVITGTWTFTTPPTVTRVEHNTETYSQFSLYDGRPAPTDTPMVLITISNDPRTFAQTDPKTYHVVNQREYSLNSALATEWSGNTSTGAGFCELLIKKPVGAGDFCHAIAIANTADQRKLGLDILASIQWKAAK